MTAGAGKTMVVDAIELLVGGRADPLLVRAGADEAWVEGRFVRGDDEVVVARAVPRSGRSRAYLDRFGRVDLDPLRAARRAVQVLVDELATMGGDERSRARELDLVGYQVAEIDAAGITGPDEDAELEALEDQLADAAAHRDAAAGAVELLSGDGTVGEGVGSASYALGATVAVLAGPAPVAGAQARLRALTAELADLAGELRATGEAIDEDPERLAQVRERRQLLHDLRRKYGETLADVIAEGDRLHARLAELEDHDRRAAELDQRLAAARKAEVEAAAAVGDARRAVAPELARRVQAHLVELAMPRARVDVAVGAADPADDVELRLAANPGTEPLPLAKVASGGELARTMLALRLVLTAAPPTLVFDEVDAGIGGDHQVLVVTHLPQVAAYADAQVRVAKQSDELATVSHVSLLDHPERVVELSRMLSGQPDSDAARVHAAELLATAAGERGR